MKNNCFICIIGLCIIFILGVQSTTIGQERQWRYNQWRDRNPIHHPIPKLQHINFPKSVYKVKYAPKYVDVKLYSTKPLMKTRYSDDKKLTAAMKNIYKQNALKKFRQVFLSRKKLTKKVFADHLDWVSKDLEGFILKLNPFEAGEFVDELNKKYLIPNGHLLVDNPLSPNENRSLILLKIEKTETELTRGPKKIFIHYARQITQFPDGAFRTPLGYSPAGKNYVVVLLDHIAAYVNYYEGNTGIHQDPSGPNKEISDLSFIVTYLRMRKSFNNDYALTESVIKSTKEHEVLHKRIELGEFGLRFINNKTKCPENLEETLTRLYELKKGHAPFFELGSYIENFVLDNRNFQSRYIFYYLGAACGNDFNPKNATNQTLLNWLKKTKLHQMDKEKLQTISKRAYAFAKSDYVSKWIKLNK